MILEIIVQRGELNDLLWFTRLLRVKNGDLDLPDRPIVSRVADNVFFRDHQEARCWIPQEINFTAQIDLRDGLERLIEWRKSHIEEVQRRRREVGLTD